jgi:hypothetical protein
MSKTNEPVAVDLQGPVDLHLDPNARQRAAFGELELSPPRFHVLEFRGVAGPEGEREGHGPLVLVLDGQDLAVLAGPELLGSHWDRQG